LSPSSFSGRGRRPIDLARDFPRPGGGEHGRGAPPALRELPPAFNRHGQAPPSDSQPLRRRGSGRALTDAKAPARLNPRNASPPVQNVPSPPHAAPCRYPPPDLSNPSPLGKASGDLLASQDRPLQPPPPTRKSGVHGAFSQPFEEGGGRGLVSRERQAPYPTGVPGRSAPTTLGPSVRGELGSLCSGPAPPPPP